MWHGWMCRMHTWLRISDVPTPAIDNPSAILDSDDENENRNPNRKKNVKTYTFRLRTPTRKEEEHEQEEPYHRAGVPRPNGLQPSSAGTRRKRSSPDSWRAKAPNPPRRNIASC